MLGFLRGRAKHTGDEEPIETVGRRQSGDVFPMELSVVEPKVQIEDHRPKGIEEPENILVCTVRDISRRKAAEEQVQQLNVELEQRVHERTRQLEEAQKELVKKERLATQGQLTATVSHELRNPLGTIRNCVRFIRKVNVVDTVDDVVDRLERNVMRCDRIIAELLDYSRERASS